MGRKGRNDPIDSSYTVVREGVTGHLNVLDCASETGKWTLTDLILWFGKREIVIE